MLLRPARTSLQTTYLLYQMKSEKSSEILKYFNFMWQTMKKLFSIILILVALLQISLTSAFATTSVSFEMQNADMKPNRLFSIALSANSANRLSAATFELLHMQSVKKQLRRKLKKRKITMTILLKTRLSMIDSEVFYFAFLPCVILRFANSRLIEFKTRFLSALHMGATSSFLSPSPVKR